MFEISFFSAELTFTAVWMLVRICIWIRQKRIDWKREAVLALMYFNLAVIIRFVFFPQYQGYYLERCRQFGHVHSKRYFAAHCIQTAGPFLESSRSRRLYFTVHRDPAAAFSFQSLRY